MTVEELLGVVGLRPSGPMEWAETCPEREPGVCLVTCAQDIQVEWQVLGAGEIVYVGKAARRRPA